MWCPIGVNFRPLTFSFEFQCWSCLSQYIIIIYDNNTVIYTSAKDHYELQQKLYDDFSTVASWLQSNDFNVNMKAGKTKCMIFETSQRVQNKELNIAYHH